MIYIYSFVCMKYSHDKKFHLKESYLGNSLEVQCLGLHTSTAGGMGLIPGQETKIPHAMWHGQNIIIIIIIIINKNKKEKSH